MRKILIMFLLPLILFAEENTYEVSQNQVNKGLETLKQTLETQEKMLNEELKNKAKLKEEAIKLIKSLSGKDFITFKRGKDIYIITFDKKNHNLAVIRENNPYLEQKLKPVKLTPAKLSSEAPKGIRIAASILGWTIYFVATVIFIGQTFFAFKEKRLFLGIFSFLVSLFLLALVVVELTGLGIKPF